MTGLGEANSANTAEIRALRAVPTVKQYEMLRMLGSGSAWLSARKRDAEPLLRRGWVTGDWRSPYWQFVRITPDGLHALARAVEKYGLQDLGPKPTTHVRVCADCGSDRVRFEERDASTYQPPRAKRASQGTSRAG